MARPGGTTTGGGALQVVVMSPEQTIYRGAADAVVAPAWDGELGVLRGHAPLMALLGTGEVRVTLGSATEHFRVQGGFLQVIDNQVTILSERAEMA